MVLDRTEYSRKLFETLDDKTKFINMRLASDFVNLKKIEKEIINILKDFLSK